MMMISKLRDNLIKNKKGIADDYASWLASNCSDDADLDTDFEQEDFENLIQFGKDWLKENIENDEGGNMKKRFWINIWDFVDIDAVNNALDEAVENKFCPSDIKYECVEIKRDGRLQLVADFIKEKN